MYGSTDMEWINHIKFLYLGIICLVIFALITYGIKKRKIKKSLGLVGCLSFLIGVFLVLGFLVSRFEIVRILMVIAIGVAMICFGIYDVSRIFLCKTQITAKCKGFSSTTKKGSRCGRPMFSFKYEGKWYMTTTNESYSQRKLYKLFRKGALYNIYIYEKDPERILVRKSDVLCGLFIILFGILIIAVVGMVMIDSYR